MTEENHPTQDKKKKIEAKPLPVDKEKADAIEKGLQVPETTIEEKKEPAPVQAEEKKEKPKKEVVKLKKEEAVARGVSLPISKKHSMYISKFIKNKKIDQAIADLTKVISFKKPVPYKGEIPHRKGRGIMSGRYPINASKYFINLLKALKGNSLVNGLNLETTRVYFASATWASRPSRARGKAKRTNVTLKAKEFPETGGEK